MHECVCMCGHKPTVACAWRSADKLAGVDFLILPCGSQGSSSGCQTWRQVLLSVEPSCWPLCPFLMLNHWNLVCTWVPGGVSLDYPWYRCWAADQPVTSRWEVGTDGAVSLWVSGCLASVSSRVGLGEVLTHLERPLCAGQKGNLAWLRAVIMTDCFSFEWKDKLSTDNRQPVCWLISHLVFIQPT